MTVLKEGYSLPEPHAQNASIRGSRFEIGQVLQTLFVVAQTQRIQLVQQDLGHLYSVFIRGLSSQRVSMTEDHTRCIILATLMMH